MLSIPRKHVLTAAPLAVICILGAFQQTAIALAMLALWLWIRSPRSKVSFAAAILVGILVMFPAGVRDGFFDHHNGFRIGRAIDASLLALAASSFVVLGGRLFLRYRLVDHRFSQQADSLADRSATVSDLLAMMTVGAIAASVITRAWPLEFNAFLHTAVSSMWWYSIELVFADVIIVSVLTTTILRWTSAVDRRAILRNLPGSLALAFAFVGLTYFGLAWYDLSDGAPFYRRYRVEPFFIQRTLVVVLCSHVFALILRACGLRLTGFVVRKSDDKLVLWGRRFAVSMPALVMIAGGIWNAVTPYGVLEGKRLVIEHRGWPWIFQTRFRDAGNGFRSSVIERGLLAIFADIILVILIALFVNGVFLAIQFALRRILAKQKIAGRAFSIFGFALAITALVGWQANRRYRLTAAEERSRDEYSQYFKETGFDRSYRPPALRAHGDRIIKRWLGSDAEPHMLTKSEWRKSIFPTPKLILSKPEGKALAQRLLGSRLKTLSRETGLSDLAISQRIPLPPKALLPFKGHPALSSFSYTGEISREEFDFLLGLPTMRTLNVAMRPDFNGDFSSTDLRNLTLLHLNDDRQLEFPSTLSFLSLELDSGDQSRHIRGLKNLRRAAFQSSDASNDLTFSQVPSLNTVNLAGTWRAVDLRQARAIRAVYANNADIANLMLAAPPSSIELNLECAGLTEDAKENTRRWLAKLPTNACHSIQIKDLPLGPKSLSAVFNQTGLDDLHLENCEVTIDDLHRANLGSKLPVLRMSLEQDRLTNETLQLVIDHCTSLRMLGCSASGITKLDLRQHPKLEAVHLHDCEGLEELLYSGTLPDVFSVGESRFAGQLQYHRIGGDAFDAKEIEYCLGVRSDFFEYLGEDVETDVWSAVSRSQPRTVSLPNAIPSPEIVRAWASIDPVPLKSSRLWFGGGGEKLPNGLITELVGWFGNRWPIELSHSDSLVVAARPLKCASTIVLDGRLVDEELCRELKKLSKFEVLSIVGSILSDEAIPLLAELPRLRLIRIESEHERYAELRAACKTRQRYLVDPDSVLFTYLNQSRSLDRMKIAIGRFQD
ncbi:MAG: hypothetical protein AAF664_16575 [Planctomycetota bacterium]